MADKATTEPAPVDVKSSIPIEVKLTPGSVAALGGDPSAVGTSAVAAAEPVAPTEPPVAPTATGTPVNVTVMAPPPPAATAIKGEGTTLAPTTTEQQDVVTQGQRRVNLIWEAVQATIAIAVTFAIIYLAIMQTPAETITNAFFLIVGFYFSRVNHESTGGVGPKPPQFPYTGR